VLSTTIYILPALLDNPVIEVPEARVACVAREMLESGNWLIPTLGGQERVMKPPLPYWMTALTAQALSPHTIPDPHVLALAARLPSALLGGLAAFVVTLYGIFAFSRAAGIAAGLILGFSGLPAYFAQLGMVDVPLMCFCALAVCAAGRIVASPNPGLLSGVCLGLGLGGAALIKEPIPFMLLVPPLCVEVLLRRKFNSRKILLYGLGLLVAAGIVLPWFIACEHFEPGVLNKMIADRTGIWQDGHIQSRRWEFYFYKFASYMLPWTLPLLGAASIYFLNRTRLEASTEADAPTLSQAQFRYFALTFVLGFCAFYASPKQQDHYLLPLLPAFALSTGYILSTFRTAGGLPETALARWTIFCGCLGGVLLAIAPLYPEILRLMNRPEQAELARAVFTPRFWWISVPVGASFAALHFVMARQWVEGRSLRAVLPMGAIALIGFLSWNIYHAECLKNCDDLYKQAPALREQLAALDEDVHIYFQEHHELNEILVLFYLGRPLPDYTQLLCEAQHGRAPEKRVLIGHRDGLKAIGLGALLTENGPPLQIVELPADWTPGAEHSSGPVAETP